VVNLCGWFVSVGVRRDRYGGGTPNAHIPSSWGGGEGKDLEEELPMYILEGFPCI
jgi:hypothetical protein